jgi:hypothetical protein
MRLTLLCTFCLLALGVNARAAAGWEIQLTVSAGRIAQHLSFGERANATDGIDGLYEVPAMPGAGLRAAFLISGGRYWRDIRPLSVHAQHWTLVVAAPRTATEVTLNWGTLPRGRGLIARLTDAASGRSVDAIGRHHYRFRNTGTRTLIFEITRQGELP